jgi:uncharacterized membrane protein
MKIKLLVGALVLLVVMNIAAVGVFLLVQTRAPRPPIEWRDEGMDPAHVPIARRLSLEERRRLFAAMRSFHEETRALAQETRALEDDLIASMGRSPVSQAHVDSLLQQISDNRLEIARRATDRMIAMGDSLTAEQRQHLVSALIQMRRAGPMRERHGWRGRQAR